MRPINSESLTNRSFFEVSFRYLHSTSTAFGPTAPLLIKTVDQVALSDSVTRGLHPGAMLANFTKTQKREREPIIEISSDEDDAGGDSITRLHQQWPLKRPNMGENDPLIGPVGLTLMTASGKR
jgi:hypothetical protein